VRERSPAKRAEKRESREKERSLMGGGFPGAIGGITDGIPRKRERSEDEKGLALSLSLSFPTSMAPLVANCWNLCKREWGITWIYII